MIPLVGAALTGLDEWMQRVGQLQIICAAGTQAEGVHRLTRRTGEILSEPVALKPVDYDRFATFARHKRLAPLSGKQSGRAKSRYPHLAVRTDSHGDHLELLEAHAEVWAQDYWLSQTEVGSKTGGVTVSGRVGSNTGVDHLIQWAQKADLLTRVGQLTPLGYLLSGWDSGVEDGGERPNPYARSPFSLVAGFCLVRADLDIFSRFLPKLLTATPPFGKKEGARMFGEAVGEVADEADADLRLSSGRRRAVIEVRRDLERAARRSKSRDDLGATATAWHRAVSRLEAYVDLGLLSKVHGQTSHSYKYKYVPTPILRTTADSLSAGLDALTWIEADFFDCLAAPNASYWEPELPDLLDMLPAAAAVLRRGRAPLPIDALGLWLVMAAESEDSKLTLAQARTRLRELAEAHSDRVRLMRGERGERAEFISLVDP